MLFRTYPRYETIVPLPPEIFGEHTTIQHWRAFELVMDDFWFIVEVRVRSRTPGEGDFWKTFVVAERNDVLELLTDADIADHRINLVIPSYQSGNQQLALKPVVKIEEGLEKDHDQIVTIYSTSDGAQYLASAVGAQDYAVRDRRTLYFKGNVNNRQAVSQ